jgi:hypothetical protein
MTLQDELREEALSRSHVYAEKLRAAADRIDALEAALDKIARTEFVCEKPASMCWALCCLIAREALEAP